MYYHWQSDVTVLLLRGAVCSLQLFFFLVFLRLHYEVAQASLLRVKDHVEKDPGASQLPPLDVSEAIWDNLTPMEPRDYCRHIRDPRQGQHNPNI
jgi:hypothetical protein